MTKEAYLQFHKEFCDQMMEITKAKNSDYTGGSADPFANFKGIGHLVDAPNVVEIGFLTRISDKIARIGSFISKGTLEVKDESVTDTLMDLANYSALFAGFLQSKKETIQSKMTIDDMSPKPSPKQIVIDNFMPTLMTDEQFLDMVRIKASRNV